MAEYVEYKPNEPQKKNLKDIGFSKGYTIMGLHSHTMFAGYIMGFSGCVIVVSAINGDIFPRWLAFLLMGVGIVIMHMSVRKALKMVYVFGNAMKEMVDKINKYEEENKKK